MFKKIIQRHKTVLIVSILFIILACIVFYKFQSTARTNYSEPLKRQTLQQTVYGIGTVTANKSFVLKPGVTSNIDKIFVKEGDVVAKDDAIISLGNAVFRAPFAGTIEQLPAKVGENVFAQSIVYSLSDLTDCYLLVSLEQRSALKVRIGQNARISFDTLREQVFTGTVEAIFSQSNNFYVRIQPQDLLPQILPGMTADVAIGVLEKPNALIIPVSALNGNKVSVKTKNGNVKTVAVTLGLADGASVEVLAGDLNEGDQVQLP